MDRFIKFGHLDENLYSNGLESYFPKLAKLVKYQPIKLRGMSIVYSSYFPCTKRKFLSHLAIKTIAWYTLFILALVRPTISENLKIDEKNYCNGKENEDFCEEDISSLITLIFSAKKRHFEKNFSRWFI